MKRFAVSMGIILLLGLGFVEAISQQEIREAKRLVESNVDCNTLSDAQLELIGEYAMERMHPGDAHELMHSMMGLEEGSEAETRFHANLAKTIYCGKNSNSTAGVVGMMPPGDTGTVGYGGMMPYFGGSMMGGAGMMGGYDTFGAWGVISLLFWILITAGLILLVVWLYKNVAGHVTGEEPMTVLKRRFASGEITRKEFEEMKKEVNR